MKKVLFLAIAALAYVGAANAQNLTGTALGTSLKAAGFDTTASVNVIQGAGAITYKLTVGGTYEFKAISTNWETALGTDWANVVKGSNLVFTGAATVGVPDYSVAAAITAAHGAQSVATITGAAALPTLTVTETSYAADGSVGCSEVAIANFNAATAPLAGITVTNPNTIQCTAANADITIATTGSDSKWIKYTLVKNVGSGDADVWGTKVADGGLTSAYQKLTDGSVKVTIPAAIFSTVGKYTLTVTKIWDKYSYEAVNRETLQTDISQVATITLMPKPTPTLKTNAIQ